MVKNLPSNAGTWVQSLVREPGSHMLWGNRARAPQLRTDTVKEKIFFLKKIITKTQRASLKACPLVCFANMLWSQLGGTDPEFQAGVLLW